MISSSLASGRRRFAAILFGAGAFVLAACESANTGSGANPSSLGVLPEGVADPAITTCGDCYLYPVGPFVGFGGSNTRITGLSNDSKVTSGTIKVPSCTPRIVAFPSRRLKCRIPALLRTPTTQPAKIPMWAHTPPLTPSRPITTSAPIFLRSATVRSANTPMR